MTAIWALCTLTAGVDCLEMILPDVPVTGVICLAERRPDESISGYTYMRPWAEQRGLRVVEVETYNLSAAADRSALSKLDLDLLLVVGWQRLIPPWLIDHATHGAIGSHGSADGIEGGRGRSPQNWALLLGAPSFAISIFRIDAGVDSGPVLATRSFPYSVTDDIASSYAKASYLEAAMIRDLWEDDALLDGAGEPQRAAATYLPQRTPEDGEIDWGRPAEAVARFVRALSRPYPGAFSRFGDEELRIWAARPLDVGETSAPGVPGEVVHVYADGRLLVRGGDGYVLVDEFEFRAGCPTVGAVLSSVSYTEQIASIVARHEARYPDLPLSPAVKAAT